MEDVKIAASRLAIINDALAQIQVERTIPQFRTYFEGVYGLKEEVKERIYADNGKCEACAIGSLFTAYARAKTDERERCALVDSLQDRGQSYTLDTLFRTKLGEYFSRRTILLMEIAFEATWVRIGDTFTEEVGRMAGEDIVFARDVLRAQRFRYNHLKDADNARETLEAILLNMEKNNGEFVPPEVPNESESDLNAFENEEDVDEDEEDDDRCDCGCEDEDEDDSDGDDDA
jgi:hypothetical protein